MRIVANDEIFAATNHPELHELLLACRDGRHQIEVQPPDAPCLESWLKVHAGSVWSHYREILDTSLRELAVSARRVTLSIPELPITPALALLKTPLCVLVENERNDSAFLRAVLRGSRAEEWRQADRNQWLVFDSPGGMQEIEQRIKSSTVEPKRTYVVFDSDAREPGQPSPAAQRLDGLCQQKELRHHMLNRRASENYLPIEALDLWLEQQKSSRGKGLSALRSLTNQFRRLTPHQRHHYNMKEGLTGDAKSPSSLFAEVKSVEQKALQAGFGTAVGQIFHQPEQLLDEWLIDDGQRGEMEALLDSILALL